MLNELYGGRAGSIADPIGHASTIATHEEDLSPEEIQRRFAAGAAALEKM